MSDTNQAWERATARFGSRSNDIYEFEHPPKIIPTNFPKLDEYLSGGLSAGAHVLMANPGCGKSALAIQMAILAALNGEKALYLSVEMTRQQCLARCCSFIAKSQLEDPEARFNSFKWSEWEEMGREGGARAKIALKALGDFYKCCPNLVIADSDEISELEELEDIIEDCANAGMGLLVVDYLQRIKPSTDPTQERYMQITAVSNSITKITKNLQIPALVISSMSRDANKSSKPSMFGGRGSGDIEYDAVTVMQLTQDKHHTRNEEMAKLMELHILKNRRGLCTDAENPILLWFDGAHNAFTLHD